MHTQTQKIKSSTKVVPDCSPQSTTFKYSHSVLQLQQQLGNQVVQRLLKSRKIQAKLTVGQPNDIYEQEADRVADQIMRMPDPIATEHSKTHLTNKTPVIQRMCSQCEEELQRQPSNEIKKEEENLLQAKERLGQVPHVSHEVENTINNLRGGGQPLSSTDRSFFEPRFGQDFSQVRIHTDAKAVDTAKAVNARAFTLGQDIVFGVGEYSSGNSSGRRLLAHELTHVVQQNGGNNLGLKRAFTQFTQQRGRNFFINRQVHPASASTPAFSVVRYNYEQMARRAIQNISGRTSRNTTFAPVVQPILQSMLAHVVWRDASGSDLGGAAFSYSVPGRRGVRLSLTMVFDDMLNPPQAGQFHHSGTNGHLILRVRRNTTVEALTEVLYHESMHMMSWIINAYGAAAVPGVPAQAVRGLNLRYHTAGITGIRRELESLEQSIYARRRASGRNQLTPNQLAQTARWLMEEIQVRAETEVFQQTLQVEQQRRARARVYISTRQYGSINLSRVSRYIFEYSRTFVPADRIGLSIDEQRILRRLTQMLEGFFQLQVRRRFSLRAYTTSIPRTRSVFTPRPLVRPNLRPLELP